MKINEQWEELKSESHANIESEKGIKVYSGHATTSTDYIGLIYLAFSNHKINIFILMILSKQILNIHIFQEQDLITQTMISQRWTSQYLRIRQLRLVIVEMLSLL